MNVCFLGCKINKINKLTHGQKLYFFHLFALPITYTNLFVLGVASWCRLESQLSRFTRPGRGAINLFWSARLGKWEAEQALRRTEAIIRFDS